MVQIDMFQTIEFCEGKGKHKVKFLAVLTKKGDVLIYIGNENSHIGCIALSIADYFKGEKKAFISKISVPKHYDCDPAEKVAKDLSEYLGKNVAVCVGIHIENADKKDIEEVMNNIEKCLKKFKEAIKCS